MSKYINVILFTTLVTGLLIFYTNYLYLRYLEKEVSVLPNSYYETKYSTCHEACNLIKSFHCIEWSTAFNKKMCEYTCDSYFDIDNLEYSTKSLTTFKCATEARSAEDLHKCGLSCTVMDEL